jgi:hypothetical protein
VTHENLSEAGLAPWDKLFFWVLEAAGSGSNLGFNYSHLEKQDKESLTEVVI